MKLETNYLGKKLRSPLVVSASPLSQEIENIKRMEEAGAGAVVLYSLFEEQIRAEAEEMEERMEQGMGLSAEGVSYFPPIDSFKLGPEEYLEHIRKAKDAVNIPIIGSLNGSTLGGWTEYAALMQEAGVDAVELNIYSIPTDASKTSGDVEASYLEILRAVKEKVSIPVAVKLSPFFSNLANMASRLDGAGAQGLVLFNRFFQPDVDLESLSVTPKVIWSTPFAQRLPLRWVAILSGQIKSDLAATSGIYTAQDVLKMVSVGASVTMLYSALARQGIGHLKTLETEMTEWLEAHEYGSLSELKGTLSQTKIADPTAFERAQFVKSLHSPPKV